MKTVKMFSCQNAHYSARIIDKIVRVSFNEPVLDQQVRIYKK